MIDIFMQYLEESRSLPKNPNEESVEFLKEDRLWTFACSKASHYCSQGTVVSSRPVIRGAHCHGVLPGGSVRVCKQLWQLCILGGLYIVMLF